MDPIQPFFEILCEFKPNLLAKKENFEIDKFRSDNRKNQYGFIRSKKSIETIQQISLNFINFKPETCSQNNLPEQDNQQST